MELAPAEIVRVTRSWAEPYPGLDGATARDATARPATRAQPRVVASQRQQTAGRRDARLDAIGDHDGDARRAAVHADRDVAAGLRQNESHRRRANVHPGIGDAYVGEVDIEFARAHVDRERCGYVARDLDLHVAGSPRV